MCHRDSRMGEHKPGRIALIVTTAVIFVVIAVLNGLANQGIPGLYVSTTGNTSAVFDTDITPAGWTFGVAWGIIYFLQAAWLLYGVVTIFRRSEGGYLYYSPDFLPATIYGIYIVNNVFNICWLVLWDRQYIGWGLGCMFVLLITLYACLIISLLALDKHRTTLVKQGNGKDVYFVIALVHNGLAAYATWITIATLLNLACVLIYITGLTKAVGSAISISILFGAVMAWAILDLAILDRYTRFLFAPHVIVMIACLGVMTATGADPINNANHTYTATLLTLTAVVTLLKIAAAIYRQKKDNQVEISPELEMA